MDSLTSFPHLILCDEHLRGHPRLCRLLDRMEGQEIAWVRGKAEALHLRWRNPNAGRVLYLTEQKGSFLKRCPGSKGMMCCNIWILNLVTGCPIGCEYCVLQEVLADNPLCTVFLNVEKAGDEIRDLMAHRRHAPIRIGTGELGDSLALEPWADVAPFLFDLFSRIPEAQLELKTKTAGIEGILGLPHGDNIILSWSVNPQPMIDEFEPFAASLEGRMGAARLACESGFQTAFHFDPILLLPGWERSYEECASTLTERIPADRVAWVSLGALRFLPALKSRVMRRTPNSRLIGQELLPGEDGKLRYPAPLRAMAYNRILRQLRKGWPSVPIYLCMETPEVWRRTLGESPDRLPCLGRLFGS